MRDNDFNARLVYSTSQGSMCPGCAQPKDACACREARKRLLSKNDGVVRIRYETKGRKGKGMTLITGLPLNEEKLLNLSKTLKQQFGTGGAVKQYIIELQGDFREAACKALSKLGYSVK